MGSFECRIRARYYQKSNHIFLLKMTWELNTNEIQLWLRNLGRAQSSLPCHPCPRGWGTLAWLSDSHVLGFSDLGKERGKWTLSEAPEDLSCPWVSREGRMLCVSNFVLCFVIWGDSAPSSAVSTTSYSAGLNGEGWCTEKREEPWPPFALSWAYQVALLVCCLSSESWGPQLQEGATISVCC